MITATKDLEEDTKLRDDVMDIFLERMKHGLLPNDGIIETLSVALTNTTIGLQVERVRYCVWYTRLTYQNLEQT